MRIVQPQSPQDFDQYYEFRWRVLRAPWNQLRGSEKDEYEAQAYHLMMIHDGRKLLGIGRMHLVGPGLAQIRFMAVEESFRNRGIGRMILQELESEAMRKGAVRIILNARSEAADFYRKAGYVVIGEGPLLFGQIRHFVMEKKFSV